ncbi:MAG TPA: choice-of-anchor tandem repeat GloVer-containing protein [Rhizomicrobium sp.]|jgi:uncharacterized repeat protein (TIGR03803 family)|nr:choice-of-anchor tandem repeat GloVer-containing protein [Rhizomicrobium sp.]
MKTVSIVLFAGIIGCALARPVPAAEAATFKVLWSFGSGTDGQYPVAGLIDERGTLYGTTQQGGIHGKGTVFSVDPATGIEAVLHSFCTRTVNCPDGWTPLAGLIDVRGKLYGTTDGGGAHCQGGKPCGGTVFSVSPGTGKEKVLFSFCYENGSCTKGFLPLASVVDVKGVLYGTTDEGGGANYTECGFTGCGTAFSLDLKTGMETQLYAFCSQQYCTDGRNSSSALIDVNGTLYGTTAAGGADHTGCGNAGCGAVYTLDPATQTETVLYSFTGGTDGEAPQGSLIAMNGLLYGVTESGGGTGCAGNIGCGTVFSIDPATGAENVLYSFCSQGGACTDGFNPLDGLIAANGKLYGTTISGGANSGGTVFSIDPNTGMETVLYSFCGQSKCADGEYPWASLIDVNGVLYGTTQKGGANNAGTVFALTAP